MGLEVAQYISQLVATNPVGAVDQVAQGDDHLRLIKLVLQTQFPNLGAAAVNATAAEINKLVGITGSLANTFLALAAADQTVTNSNVFQNDNTLSIAVTNGSTYLIDLFARFTCASITPDAKWRFTGPTVAYGYGTEWDGFVLAGANNLQYFELLAAAGLSMQVNTDVHGGFLTIRGTFKPSADGTLQFQWAQQVSDANGTTRKAGSFLRLTKVA